MAKTEHYFTQFEAEKYYHVYNRTIDKGKLFSNSGNYIHFLKKFDEYLNGFVETYAYCMLGNHFHWLIGVLPEDKIKHTLQSYEAANPTRKLAKKSKPISEKTVHEIISHQFKKFFQSYAMAYNIQQNRVGTLFQTPFKRALVDDDNYFTNMIHYIHSNPQKHGFVDDFRTYEWSSYNRMLIDKPTKLKKKEVLDWFGDKEKYIEFHKKGDCDLPKNWDLDD
jgi:putative transposase